ncbi:hypothetical protein LTR78_007014 [Recurvomyces mirabilis]|uniref:Uncharacterized protein n=1 Tax=Recurvomyces mirabilis TaxID=574656 RepID=A0AAE1BZ48_9PEZI|nr:hypothetical protein LTR78_007014 [Recurvomyces mirabilis]KAK5153398.1 hypothetical protein LTS14_007567 [Recurvomyces mirabilis]
MPSILSDDDKQTVKRTVPKATNKIHAVAVAKLYISLPQTPHPTWQPTNLQGALVLANDLVGNTFWLKLVDVSPANRGVIWDQEIYDSFQWFQDRTFFHSFEGEECLFGFSFVDEKEARQLRKKVEEREKNAAKGTKGKAFALGPPQSAYSSGGRVQSLVGGGLAGAGLGAGGGVGGGGGAAGKSHGRFGGLFHRHSSANATAQTGPSQSIIPPRGVEIHNSNSNSYNASPNTSRPASASGIDLSDPAVQAVLQDLLQMGITEDQIEEHADFIRTYLEQNKATAAANQEKKDRAARAPPPPPPPPAAANLSPQNTGSSSGTSKRGPPPAPPPSRRAGGGTTSTPSSAIQRPPSPSPSPPREPSPPRPRFRAPPPLADAGKFAQTPELPTRGRAGSTANAAPAVGIPGPPPPPRPPKTPLIEDQGEAAAPYAPASRFAVPPPFEGKRVGSAGLPPPPTPARNVGGAAGAGAAGVPPPPPPRDSHALPPAAVGGLPPPPRPRASPNPNSGGFGDGPPPAPPLPPPNFSRPVPPAPGGSGPPLPPSLPPPNASAVGAGGPPPPPPPPPSMPPRGAGAGPPPPPALPPPGASAAPAAPAAPGRDGLLADIQKGARLKKVSDAEKRDRSAVAVPGGEPATPAAGAGAGAAGGGQDAASGGLAGALASALAARKSKVSHSDDEKDDDDW